MKEKEVLSDTSLLSDAMAAAARERKALLHNPVSEGETLGPAAAIVTVMQEGGLFCICDLQGGSVKCMQLQDMLLMGITESEKHWLWLGQYCILGPFPYERFGCLLDSQPSLLCYCYALLIFLFIAT